MDPSFWSQASVSISGGAAVAGMDGGADSGFEEHATLDLRTTKASRPWDMELPTTRTRPKASGKARMLSR